MVNEKLKKVLEGVGENIPAMERAAQEVFDKGVKTCS